MLKPELAEAGAYPSLNLNPHKSSFPYLQQTICADHVIVFFDYFLIDLHAAFAALQQRLDTALAREATLAEELATQTAELAQRNTDYSERIEHQAATIDVLKAMSASPGDPQPVFDLIVRRATELCNGLGTTLLEFDGGLVHYRASYFTEGIGYAGERGLRGGVSFCANSGVHLMPGDPG